MKIVKTYQNRMDADIAKGFLQSQGIVAVVSSDDQGGLDPALRAQFGAELRVSEADLERAEQIIATLEAATPLEEGESN